MNQERPSSLPGEIQKTDQGSEFRKSDYPLTASGITYSYRNPDGSEACILDNISMRARKGEISMILGPSGCGKTTLLTLFGCIRQLQKGSLVLDGIRVTPKSSKEIHLLRSNVGMVFQSHRLINFLNTKDNIIYGLRAYKAYPPVKEVSLANHLIAAVGLAGLGQRYPAELSSGQCQRVAIARALVHEPRIILADEPTSSLDADSARIVMELLKSECQKRQLAVIMTTHDTRILQYASKVWSLTDSKLIQSNSSP